MKILELEYRSPPAIGGVEKHVMEISKQFKTREFNVEIWSTDLLNFSGTKDVRSERVFNGIKIRKFCSFKIPRFLPPFFMYRLVYPKMFVELLKLRKEDMAVHSHSFPSFHSYLTLFFRKKFRKVTVTPHFDIDDLKDFASQFLGKLALRILRFFVNRTNNIYLSAVTIREMKFYVNNLGFDKRKVRVIPNGSDLEEFDSITCEEVSKVKKQYNIERTFNVIFVGRLAKIKGINVLMEAISRLNNLYIRLVVAGPDFGALSELQKLSKRISLGDRIIFTGVLERRKLCVLIKSCDVLVLPSYREPFGIVLVEAMACSKPVIGAKTGGIPEIIREGENGFLFDVGSIYQLSERINLLYQDRYLCKKFGNAGREIVEKYYTWENVAEAYLKLWRS